MSAATPKKWNEWLRDQGAETLITLPPAVGNQVWNPTDQDKLAAWELYTELRTRIASQPLHYLHGDESTALKSVAELFKTARELMRKGTPNARHFATITAFTLNQVVRPFTARWHKKSEAKELDDEDTRREFRKQLFDLQKELRRFTTLLGAMAERTEFVRESESWFEKQSQQTPVTDVKVPFYIAYDDSVPEFTAGLIRHYEHNEIRRRRGWTPPADYSPKQEIDDAIRKSQPAPLLPAPTDADRLCDISGLAISGGGIRSGTFALGVVQQLAERGVLPHFDYLSTVSGGGYLGSFLSTFLNSDSQNGNIGLSGDKLPFENPPVGESAAVRHLRAHSKYLLYGGFLNRLNMFLLAIHGVFANILIFLPLLAGLLFAVVAYQEPAIQELLRNRTAFGTYFWHLGSQQCAVFGMIAAMLTLAPASVISKWLRCDFWLPYWQRFVAFVVGVGVLVTLWNIIPPTLVAVHYHFFEAANWKAWLPTTAWISGAIVVVQRIWANLNLVPMAGKVKRFVSMLILGIVGPLFFVALFLCLGEYLIVRRPMYFDDLISYGELLALLTFVPLVFTALALDVNQTSLHPFYRRKLSEAFLISHFTNAAGGNEVHHHDITRLSELRKDRPRAPYHLINCALNMPSSETASVHGRGTDFFLFSQLFSGSAATGYHPTTAWEQEDSHLNLGTAMAISAAAASPFMGLGSIPGAQLLMTAFNLRLDYWMAVPGRWGFFPVNWRAGPWYLLRQAFGWMDETMRFVNISDGGHIENLALYELFRRRCKFIVAIDGECDPSLACGGLMQVVRFAKIDFGIELDVDITRFRLNARKCAPFHFMLATIHYPELQRADSPAATGYMLYVKLSATGNEPPHVLHYSSRNTEFPHESTADQFFDEEQFEAYRALGYHVAEDLFSAELLGDQSPANWESVPDALKAWFERISHSLQDPMKR